MTIAIACQLCQVEGPYYIVEITDDYVLVRCPEPDCEHEFTLTAARDMEK